MATPEEEELARQEEVLADLSRVLADRTLELADIRLRLNAFEARYSREVGDRYVRLTAAYARSDEASMRALLREWNESPEAVEGDGAAERLVRAIRAVSQVRKGILEAEERIQGLLNSDTCVLMARVAEAELSGRSLLAELAASLDGQIADLESTLFALGVNR